MFVIIATYADKTERMVNKIFQSAKEAYEYLNSGKCRLHIHYCANPTITVGIFKIDLTRIMIPVFNRNRKSGTGTFDYLDTIYADTDSVK